MATPAAGKPDPAPDAEANLVRRLVDGDQAAWTEFVVRYQNLVWSCVRGTAQRYRLEMSAADIEDTVADVFASLLERDCAPLRHFQGRCSLATWLIVIARRCCLRRVRKSMSRPSPRPDNDFVAREGSVGSDPLEDLVRQENQQFVRSALDQLSSTDRQVLELHHQQCMNYAEIGRELGISVNSVGPRIHRAQQRLRRLLERPPAALPQRPDGPVNVPTVAATGENRAELEHG